MSDLPPGWAWSDLRSVAQIEMGQSPPGTATNAQGRGLPLIGGAADFVDGRVVPGRYTEQPTKISQAGDLILCIRATIGKVAQSTDAYCLGRGVAGLRPEAVDETFLRFLLRKEASALDEAGNGTKFRQVDKATLSAWPVPLPPLAEQRRIAARLETLTNRTARARAELDRIPALAKRQKQAVLAAAYRGDLTAGWRAQKAEPQRGLTRLDAVCVSITDGDHQAPPKAAMGIPFITISAMNGGKIDLDKATRYVPKAYLDALKPTRVAKPGDVLYSVTGSIGIPALVETELPFVFQRHIAVIKPRPDTITGQFLALMLAAPSVVEQANAVATGTAQLTVPLSGLRAFLVPCPTLDEQAETVSRVNAALNEIDRLVAEAVAARRLLDRLDDAILVRAFRGELVAQDPADEPASALLDRIRAERAAGPAKRGRGRRARAA